MSNKIINRLNTSLNLGTICGDWLLKFLCCSQAASKNILC